MVVIMSVGLVLPLIGRLRMRRLAGRHHRHVVGVLLLVHGAHVHLPVLHAILAAGCRSLRRLSAMCVVRPAVLACSKYWICRAGDQEGYASQKHFGHVEYLDRK